MKVWLIVAITVLLTVSYCAHSLKRQQEVIEMVDDFSIKSAIFVRNFVTENNKCPTKLEGWEKTDSYGDYQLEIWVGEKGNSLPIFFKCEEGLKYSFIVKHGMDSGIYLDGKGGGDIELTFGHFTDLQNLYFGKNPNIDAIKEQIHNY